MLSVGWAIRSAVAGAMILPERWRRGVAYNPLSARTAQDPYPAYAALRDRAPVHRSRLLKSWVFTRHADVGAILRDHRRFGNDPRTGTLSSRQRAHAAPAARVHAAVSGSSGPHAAAGARQQRLHPESRQCARVPRPQHIGGPAGRHRRPLRVRSHGGGGPAPACDRHGRDAGRSGRRQGPIRGVGRPSAPVCWNRRSAGANAGLAERPPELSTPIFDRSSRSGGPRRGRTSSAPWCARRTKVNS